MTEVQKIISDMQAQAAPIIAAMDYTVKAYGAQGEVTFQRVSEIPASYVAAKPDHAQGFIVAHSETGHHHVLEREGVEYFPPVKEDALVAFARIVGEAGASVKHLRQHDTHPTIGLTQGIWKITHAREEDILGEVRRVQD